MLNNSWRERRKTLFSENAEKMKRLLDNTQQKLDEVNTVILLYVGGDLNIAFILFLVGNEFKKLMIYYSKPTQKKLYC